MIDLRIIVLTALFSIGLCVSAMAAGSAGPSEDATDPAQIQAFRDGQAAAGNEDWALAVRHFQEAVNLDPKDADALNMLAFSQRHTGDLESAFANYEKALAIDPNHKEAREYLGEAYLLIGDLEGAVGQLEALDDICWFSCEEYDELEEAIEAYKAKAN